MGLIACKICDLELIIRFKCSRSMQMSWYDKIDLLAEVELANIYPSLALG